MSNMVVFVCLSGKTVVICLHLFEGSFTVNISRKEVYRENGKNKNTVKISRFTVQCSLGLSPPRSRFIAKLAYRQNSRLPISPIANTQLYCQTQLPPSATAFQTQKS